MKTIEISKGGTTAPKQIKPHQFEAGKEYWVQCTPGQRAEIIRIAEEYGRGIFADTANRGDDYPNLVFGVDVYGTWATPEDDPHCNWISFNEFVARLKGEWVEPKQIKPHQFEEGKEYWVECTPGQRAEIIRIAEEYGRGIFADTPNIGDSHPNLGFWGHVCGTCATPKDHPHWNWIPFDEFVARLKGEWVEPKEIRIPFDASRIAEAIRFETRDGREVRCVVVNDVEAAYPVTGYLSGEAWTWTKSGRYETNNQNHLDLFMVVKEVRND